MPPLNRLRVYEFRIGTWNIIHPSKDPSISKQNYTIYIYIYIYIDGYRNRYRYRCRRAYIRMGVFLGFGWYFEPLEDPDVIQYWCWDTTTSVESNRNAASFTSSSSGAIRNADVASFRGANMPGVADPGCPKGAGKGSPADEATGKGNGKAAGKGAKGNKGGKGGKGDGSRKPKTKTPEQESRAVSCQKYWFSYKLASKLIFGISVFFHWYSFKQICAGNNW